MTIRAAIAVFLITFALNDVGPLGLATAEPWPKSSRVFPAEEIHGAQAFAEDSGRRETYLENSSYYSGGEDDEDDYNTDVNSGRERQEHEDQLDQDDPVSTVTVTAVRGSVTLLPCDIRGGNNDGLPRQTPKKTSTGGEDKTLEDRAYMVLWFKHRHQSTIRHRNNKSRNKKISSGGKPLYSFDVRGRSLAQALKWSSNEEDGGFGTRASFIVFNSGSGGQGRLFEQRLLSDDYAGNANVNSWRDEGVPYDNSSRAALRVMNVTEKDAGAYRCRVDFRDSPTRNYRIILRVIVPPDKMTIIYNEKTEIDGGTHHVVGPFPEGSQLILVCKVQGGKPKPRVQWYSADGKVTTSLNTGTVDFMEENSFGTNNDDDEEITTKKLVIPQLNRRHANSTYTCLAGNDNTVESNLRMSVLINMYLNVKSVRIFDIRPTDESENIVNYSEDDNNNGVLQKTNLISGKWYTGECWSDGASPKATFEWSIDGNGTLAEETASTPSITRITVIEQTEHSSRIRFRPTPSDDGRYLRCRAWNPDINMTKDNIKNKALLLNVQYPPIVKLNLGHTFDPGRIKTGDDVYFECKVLDGGGSRRKQRNNIEWYHNGRPILQNGILNGSVSVNSDTKVVLLSAGTLVIRNVGQHHSGRYTCQCSNGLGMGRSLPVVLRVQYAPVCVDDGTRLQLIGVEKTDDSVRVLCRVRADPADDRMQFEWLVWPGTTTTGLQQQSPGPAMTAAGNYVTTALSVAAANNGTTAGLAVGELVLPAAAVGVVSEVAQYADRMPNGRKPIVLETVSCRATNAVGRQQDPCLYHIVPASPPAAFTGCEIRLPERRAQHRLNDDANERQNNNRRRASSADDVAENQDTAIVSCGLGSDGGVRPVTYSLEVYESKVATGSAEKIAEAIRNKYRGEWLADNVTGTVTGDTVEYRVNRKTLQLRTGSDESRKYLSLSAYASNRIGRGPQTYFGSDNSFLLRHSWWWRSGSTDDGGSKTTVDNDGTSSTEWWILLGGNDDRQTDPTEDDGDSDKDNDGTASLVYVSTAAVTMTTVVVACVIVAWRKRIAVRTTAETAIAANLIAPDRAAHDDEKSNANYAHLLPQERIQRKPIYPNLNAAVDPDDGCDTVRRPDSEPDIMVRHNYGKLQCLISIADRGIPGPESCV